MRGLRRMGEAAQHAGAAPIPLGGERNAHFRKIDFRPRHIIREIGEDVQRHLADDLDDHGVFEAGFARRSKISVRNMAARRGDGFGESRDSAVFGVRRRAFARRKNAFRR